MGFYKGRRRDVSGPRRVLSNENRKVFFWVKNFIAYSGHGVSEKELIKEYPAPESSEHIKLIKNALSDLEESKIIFIEEGKAYYGSKKYRNKKLKCKLSIAPSGFGYGIPVEKSEFEKIFLPKQYLGASFNGDVVSVGKITETNLGAEGVVLGVIEKTNMPLFLIVNHKNKNNQFLCLSKTSPHITFVISESSNVKEGDIIEAKLTNESHNEVFANEHVTFEVSLIKIIGNIEQAKTDTEISKLEHGLNLKFSEDVMSEVEAINKNRYDFLKEGDRVDYRDQSSFTIDPETSKDFDDAIFVDKKDDGSYVLYVHIADVTNYVKPGSCIDIEASNRCNSTYFPNHVVPMLPFALSDDLCSLVPGEDRPTSSVEIHINKNGEVKNYKVCKGIIRSKKRFTYRESRSVIESKVNDSFKIHLDSACELYEILYKKRIKDGYIPITTNEIKINVDKDENPIGVDIEEYDITHQLIEVFMVKANETVARHVSENLGKDSIFRIHENPDSKSLDIFVDKARKLGISIPKTPTKEDISRILDSVQGTETGSMLTIDYIQHMKKAIYSTENKGHYGLNLEFYSHFTSPIRRYADLVLHRLAYDSSEISEKYLKDISIKCSEKERNSSNAEKQTVKMKKLRLIRSWMNENQDREYNCIVNKVFNNKVIAEIVDLWMPVQIMLHSFRDAFYCWSEADESLVAGNGKRIKRGTKIKINITGVNLIDGRIDCVVV